ncbi:MAG TPA: DUF1569 domain-containing protein [Terriglobales bacterium]|nr:DUF1569 domain-containing protein [Terriglobales bacterium]
MDSYLERLQRELDSATKGATGAGLEQAPAGKWNAVQILEHLFLTYKNTNKGIGKCLEGGVPLATGATFRHRIGILLVVRLGYLPSGRKAPERTIPRGMGVQEVGQAIFPEIQRMESGLRECEDKFGPRTKIMDHPILGPLTAAEWRKFHWLHGRHHARQIRQRLGKS